MSWDAMVAIVRIFLPSYMGVWDDLTLNYPRFQYVLILHCDAGHGRPN